MSYIFQRGILFRAIFSKPDDRADVKMVNAIKKRHILQTRQLSQQYNYSKCGLVKMLTDSFWGKSLKYVSLTSNQEVLSSFNHFTHLGLNLVQFYHLDANDKILRGI